MDKAEVKAAELYPSKDGTEGICVTWLQRNAYVKGYREALKDAGWVMCEERIPEEEFDDGYTMVFVMIRVDDDTYRHTCDYIRNGKWELNPDADIIAWMPIPVLEDKKK